MTQEKTKDKKFSFSGESGVQILGLVFAIGWGAYQIQHLVSEVDELKEELIEMKSTIIDADVIKLYVNSKDDVIDAKIMYLDEEIEEINILYKDLREDIFKNSQADFKRQIIILEKLK